MGSRAYSKVVQVFHMYEHGELKDQKPIKKGQGKISLTAIRPWRAVMTLEEGDIITFLDRLIEKEWSIDQFQRKCEEIKDYRKLQKKMMDHLDQEWSSIKSQYYGGDDTEAEAALHPYLRLSDSSEFDNYIERLKSVSNNMKKMKTTTDFNKADYFYQEMSLLNVTITISMFKIDENVFKTEREHLKSTFSEIQINNGEIVIDLDDIRRDLNNMNERHLDLQTRSMRENLVFTGIRLKNFMYTELKMETTVDFHRAHRFGKETEFRDKRDGSRIKTRPVVGRFKNYKDREIVRSSAKELKGTHFGIQEQFPKEINDKRKMLWPYSKQAKEDIKEENLFETG
ncbi:unnamed protein product [Mytilus coruscus]|uniref:Uncharacterized protein n=1 Tax=Mytilus coruscus TaxID=42192 RepID=A0A6J7ZY16_MYTCO|nr:unnamed protein product [Mytilus coruscus]